MEAIAMSRVVVIPDHISNHYYLNFSNVFRYDPNDLGALRDAILRATRYKPQRLSHAETRMLTWKHATARLMNIMDDVIPDNRKYHYPCLWKYATAIVCTKEQAEHAR